jgi:exonuclease V
MASPAIQTIVDESTNDSDTDYGSDFSPEEEQIVGRLLSGQVEIEDNPIVSEIEHHEVQHNLRLPRVLGRERQSPLFQAVRDAENFFGQISDSVKHRKHYPDCKVPESLLGRSI